MLNISDYLKEKAEYYITDTKTKGSERGSLLKELYQMYSSPHERALRKKENWKRYCKWCRDNRKANTPENVALFKKSKCFIKEVGEDRLWYFVSHVPLKDLYIVKSTMMDKINRDQSASSYVISLSKAPSFPQVNS